MTLTRAGRAPCGVQVRPLMSCTADVGRYAKFLPWDLPSMMANGRARAPHCLPHICPTMKKQRVF